MTAEMAAPAWMHEQIAVKRYDFTGVGKVSAPFPVELDLGRV
ncbi:hypothetical protein [Streptomyces sp. DSM 118878]